MNRQELELRKELAVMHLRIARTELALERESHATSLRTVGPAVDLAAAFLEQHRLGRWGHYLRLVLRVARVFLNLQQAG